MFVIVSIMLCGVAAGYALRHHNIRKVQSLITVLIWALLFLLGAEIGSDPYILSGLSGLGGQALLLACGGLMGSLIGAWALWRWAQGRGKEARDEG
ncbi:MAG: LysO family transporter [Prevotella sp.]